MTVSPAPVSTAGQRGRSERGSGGGPSIAEGVAGDWVAGAGASAEAAGEVAPAVVAGSSDG
jgi:hypothetical protein